MRKVKLIMTKGLPGSGKTTWAKKYLHRSGKTVLISKDDIRAMCFDSAYSRSREPFILGIRDAIISLALQEGNNVITHDTNLNSYHEERLRELAQKYNAQFIVKDFTKVPLEVCLKQNTQREEVVPENVIISMHKDFIVS